MVPAQLPGTGKSSFGKREYPRGLLRKGPGGEAPIHWVNSQYTTAFQKIMDLGVLLSRGSGGEHLPLSFLAVHPSVSVSLIDRCIGYGGSGSSFTYAPVRVYATRESVGKEVERYAGQDFLSSVSLGKL
jgi:hypothetical protein